MLCPNCKKEIENGAVFCEHCGTRIKKSKKGLWITLSVVFVAIIATIVVTTIQEQQEQIVREQYLAAQYQREVERQLQAERKARQEAERQAEAQRKAKEEAERQAELARQEAARKAAAERKAELARQEAARKAEAERKAELVRQEAARKAEAERKAEQEQKCYIDLGLPSGTKWKNANEDHDNKYTYDQAISKYGQRMPTKWQCEELVNNCKWSWTGNGMRVTGPNGNSIFFPVEDLLCVWMSDYWSSTRGKGDNAYALKITNKDGVGVDTYYTEVERFVRLVK